VKPLPATIHEVDGNHRVAIDRAADISKYVTEAVNLLTAAYKQDIGAHHRAGLLREGDETLQTVIRFANCAREYLRSAYCRNDD
jgi:3-oxoacyl-ACP reductase-like protein